MMHKWLLMSVFAASAHGAAGARPFNLHYVHQSLMVNFKSPEAAQRARPEILPLYHGATQAFSSRWDDNNFDDLKVKEIMDRHGIKGTFYLNGSAAWHGPSETGISVTDPKQLPALLLKGGNSIGGHSVDHEFMPALSRNEMFYQVMRLRIDRELASQSPVISWAYPFSNWRGIVEGDAVQRDLYEVIRRAGFIHLAEHKPQQALPGPFLESTLICADGGGPMDKSFDEYLRDSSKDSKARLWSSSMHAWPKSWGGKEFSSLDSLYRKWAGKKDWWYCSQNEWAAYVAQFQYGKMRWEVHGTQGELSLDLPAAFDTGAEIPLSVALRGVQKKDLSSEAYQLADGTPAMDIAHDGSNGLPASYGSENISAELSALGDSKPPKCLTLTISNHGSSMQGLTIRLRAPLAWEGGLIEKEIKALDSGASTKISFCPSSFKSDFLYSADRFYAAAQLDYIQDKKRRRLWAEFSGAGPAEDKSYPRQGFALFGPLPGNKASLDPMASSWEPGTRVSIPGLSPDIIPAGGKSNTRAFYVWDKNVHADGQNLHYMLWSKIQTSKARTVTVMCDRNAVKGIWLNAEKRDSNVLDLKAGENDIKIIYAVSSDSFHESQYGAFFRLNDEEGRRISDLKYLRPSGTKVGH